MNRFAWIPTHIEIITATIDAMTPQAPFTPHIHGVSSDEWRSVSRMPIGKQ